MRLQHLLSEGHLHLPRRSASTHDLSLEPRAKPATCGPKAGFGSFRWLMWPPSGPNYEAPARR
jgi:hypothetical protein